MGDFLNRLVDMIMSALKRIGLMILGERPEDHPSAKHVPKLNMEAPKKPKRKRYPRKRKEVVPEYRRSEILAMEDHLPTDNILAYKWTLVCPVCGMVVKRADSYCRECGNHLFHDIGKEETGCSKLTVTL